ncbi:MAG: MATE family efflux transporter [Clostridia bacterium]|nr:MATE family efflux transporter [Clostridia bacterium]
MKKQTLLREFIRYASAQVLGMIGLSVYILADTFFIAQALGTAGLAALNLALPVYNAVSGVGVMLGVGAAIRYAVARGRGSDGLAAVRAAMWCGLGASALFIAAGLGFSVPIAAMLGADEAVFAMTETYLRVILLFSPAFITNQILQSFVRSDGAPRLSMLAMLGGSLTNIVLDYVFMCPCGMGIFGAVLATGGAPVVSMLILAPHFRGGRGRALLWNTPDWRSLPRTAALGLPSLVGELAGGVVILTFNAIMLRLGGNTAVAAYGVIANLAIVTTCIHNGIAQGVQPLLSRAHGAGQGRDFRRLVGYAAVAAFLCAALLYGLLFLFAEPVTAVFNSEDDPTLQALAVPGLRLYFSALFFAGVNTLAVAALSAAERALPAQIVSVARGIAVIVPVAFAMAAMWGMTGAWLAYAVAEGSVMVGMGGWLAARGRRGVQV